MHPLLEHLGIMLDGAWMMFLLFAAMSYIAVAPLMGILVFSFLIFRATKYNSFHETWHGIDGVERFGFVAGVLYWLSAALLFLTYDHLWRLW